MYIRKSILASLIAVCATAGLLSSANASPIGTVLTFGLTISQPASGLPAGPYGTVQLTQQADDVDVLVTLATGYAFAKTGSEPVPAFVFNLGSLFSSAAVSVTGASSAWFIASGSGSFNQTPYGEFTNAIDFQSAVGNGLSAGIVGPLSFSVAQAGISLGDFALSGAHNGGQPGGYKFSADVGFIASGKTGNVANDPNGELPPQGTPVPEPGSLALAGLGLLAAGLARKRSK